MKSIEFVVKGCLVGVFLSGCCVVSVLTGMGAFAIFSDPEYSQTKILIISGFISFITLAIPVTSLVFFINIKPENNNGNPR